jgi:hypothetical protein
MENTNAHKMIEHIEEAKDWLDKAKTEYSNLNPARGGLILNLAHAEVKHAWELSNQQCVSKNIPQLRRNSKLKYMIPVAACLALFGGLLIGARMIGFYPATDKLKANQPVVGSATTGSKVLKTVDSAKTQPNSTLAEPNSTEVIALGNQPAPLAAPAQTPSVVKPAADSIRNTDSVLGRAGTEVIQKKPALKAVSKFAIDEDALAKEASHSLRIGK